MPVKTGVTWQGKGKPSRGTGWEIPGVPSRVQALDALGMRVNSTYYVCSCGRVVVQTGELKVL